MVSLAKQERGGMRSQVLGFWVLNCCILSHALQHKGLSTLYVWNLDAYWEKIQHGLIRKGRIHVNEPRIRKYFKEDPLKEIKNTLIEKTLSN